MGHNALNLGLILLQIYVVTTVHNNFSTGNKTPRIYIYGNYLSTVFFRKSTYLFRQQAVVAIAMMVAQSVIVIHPKLQNE